MFSHDDRDAVGVGLSNVGRTAGARVDDEGRVKSRIRGKKVGLLIARQSGERVDLRWIEFGINQETTGIAIVPEDRYHPHITGGSLAGSHDVAGIGGSPSEVLLEPSRDEDHAIGSDSLRWRSDRYGQCQRTKPGEFVFHTVGLLFSA